MLELDNSKNNENSEILSHQGRKIFQYPKSKRTLYKFLPILYVILYSIFVIPVFWDMDSFLYNILSFSMLIIGFVLAFSRAMFVHRQFSYDHKSLYVHGPGFDHVFHWRDVSDILVSIGYTSKQKSYLLRIKENLLFYLSVKTFTLFDDSLENHEELALHIAEQITVNPEDKRAVLEESINLKRSYYPILFLLLTPLFTFVYALIFVSQQNVSEIYRFTYFWFYFILILLIIYEYSATGKLQKMKDRLISYFMVLYGFIGVLIYFDLVVEIPTMGLNSIEIKLSIFVCLLTMALLSFKLMVRGFNKIIEKYLLVRTIHTASDIVGEYDTPLYGGLHGPVEEKDNSEENIDDEDYDENEDTTDYNDYENELTDDEISSDESDNEVSSDIDAIDQIQEVKEDQSENTIIDNHNKDELKLKKKDDEPQKSQDHFDFNNE